MTGSNRRPSACKADALPAELILHILHLSVMAWRRPTLVYSVHTYRFTWYKDYRNE